GPEQSSVVGAGDGQIRSPVGWLADPGTVDLELEGAGQTPRMAQQGLQDRRVLLRDPDAVLVLVTLSYLPGQQGRAIWVNRLACPLKPARHADPVSRGEVVGPVVETEQLVPAGDVDLASVIEADPADLLADVLAVQARDSGGSDLRAAVGSGQRVG